MSLLPDHAFDVLSWIVTAITAFSGAAYGAWLTIRAAERQQQQQEEAVERQKQQQAETRQKALLLGLFKELEEAVVLSQRSFAPELRAFFAPIALVDLAPLLAGGIVDPISQPDLFQAIRRLHSHITLYQKYAEAANPILIDTANCGELRRDVFDSITKLHKQALDAREELLRQLSAQGFMVVGPAITPKRVEHQ